MKEIYAIIFIGLVGFVLVNKPFEVTQYLNPSSKAQLEIEALQYDIDDYFRTNVFLHKTAVDIVHEMSREQKAGQLLMPAWEKNQSRAQFIAQAKQLQVGGMMTLRNDVAPEDIQAIQTELVQEIGTKELQALLSIDAEPSLMSYRIPSSSYRQETANLATQEEAAEAARVISSTISHYGYNLNFAPVYDSGRNTTVIGSRAFGVEAEEILSRANSFTQATKEARVIPTAKHFPGHGYALGDTHLSLQSIPGELYELPVFVSAIQEAQVPVVMVGHLAVSGGEYDTNGLPATISATTTQLLLRNNLEFEGVIITDAMTMGALDDYVDVDMRALDSGVDIVLMPRSIEKTHTQLVSRMSADPDYEQEINEKVYRIVRLKLVHQWTQSMANQE